MSVCIESWKCGADSLPSAVSKLCLSSISSEGPPMTALCRLVAAACSWWQARTSDGLSVAEIAHPATDAVQDRRMALGVVVAHAKHFESGGVEAEQRSVRGRSVTVRGHQVFEGLLVARTHGRTVGGKEGRYLLGTLARLAVALIDESTPVSERLLAHPCHPARPQERRVPSARWRAHAPPGACSHAAALPSSLCCRATRCVGSIADTALGSQQSAAARHVQPIAL